jgi:hypothetical protein
MAALPTGYAYRLGIAGALMIGLVQGREQWRESQGSIESGLKSAGVSWLVAGLRCDEGQRSIGGVASVQWTEGDGQAIRIGDGALARDSLASQGIANGISAALGMFESADPHRAYRARIDTERATHLATLERLFTTCRYGTHPFWHDYRLFLGQHLDHRATMSPLDPRPTSVRDRGTSASKGTPDMAPTDGDFSS